RPPPPLPVLRGWASLPPLASNGAGLPELWAPLRPGRAGVLAGRLLHQPGGGRGGVLRTLRGGAWVDLARPPLACVGMGPRGRHGARSGRAVPAVAHPLSGVRPALPAS